MSSTNDIQARSVLDFGRSMMKQVSSLSKTRDEQTETGAMAMPLPANDVTVVSPNVQLSGTIITPDELHIAGTINGNVAATAITIRASGVVTGDVAAQTLVVHGRIEGRIFATSVQLCTGAVVIGDIVAAQLRIETDAVFEGASRRSPDALSEAPEFSRAA